MWETAWPRATLVSSGGGLGFRARVLRVERVQERVKSLLNPQQHTTREWAVTPQSLEASRVCRKCHCCCMVVGQMAAYLSRAAAAWKASARCMVALTEDKPISIMSALIKDQDRIRMSCGLLVQPFIHPNMHACCTHHWHRIGWQPLTTRPCSAFLCMSFVLHHVGLGTLDFLDGGEATACHGSFQSKLLVVASVNASSSAMHHGIFSNASKG